LQSRRLRWRYICSIVVWFPQIQSTFDVKVRGLQNVRESFQGNNFLLF
jgi:hypothetical protein